MLAWARATFGEQETLALLAEARAEGGRRMADVLPELERLLADPE